MGRKLTLIPTNKFVNTVEYGYQFVRNDMGEGIIGHGFKKHVPFLATLFFFILISNFVGLIPGCKTPDGHHLGDLGARHHLVYLLQRLGHQGQGRPGLPEVLRPGGPAEGHGADHLVLELISTCIRWLTLAVRLYGNMFAGHMVLGIFALASSVFLTCGIQALDPLTGVLSLPWFLLLIAMYALETLVAFLQAYVFTVLSAVYVQIATSAH